MSVEGPGRRVSVMHVLCGTSGFSYPAWRGSFYPDGLPAAAMLAFYASRLPAVELNNSFYRMPKPSLLARWAAETPASFRFALKSPAQITHMRRLKNVGTAVGRLARGVRSLGARCGPILFGLPPNMRKDAGVLDAFLAALPAGLQAAVEFRHASWLADDVFAVLQRHDAALCVADTEELSTPFVATAGWGYVRLRRPQYDRAALRRWAKRLAAQRYHSAYVFFRHEDEGAGPALAQALRGMMI
jgi:uncharacterized protein YecE (DUF72 family)